MSTGAIAISNTPHSTARPHSRSSWAVVLAALLLLCIPWRSLSSASLKSATFDETIHLANTIHSLKTGDFGLPFQYPPLIRWLAAGALWPIADSIRDTEPIPLQAGAVAQRVVFLDNDGDALLARARMPIVALHLLLALGVYVVSRRLWGEAGGLVSLTLAASSPSLLAHGRLLTTDLPVTAFSFLAVSLTLSLWQRASPARIIVGGLAIGLALLAKHSALLLLAVVPLLLLLRAFLPMPWMVSRTFEKETQFAPARLRLAALSLAALAAIAAATVWAGHGFRFEPVSPDETHFAERSREIDALRRASEPESRLAAAAIDLGEDLHLLPRGYLLGVRHTVSHMERRLSYFLGERSIEGNLWYFPVAVAVKTPLGLFLLLALGLSVAIRADDSTPVPENAASLRGSPRLRLLLLGALSLFPLLFFATSMSSNLNIGHRHVLPIYPFLFVLAGGSGALLAAGTWWQRTLAGAGVLWFVGASLWIHPDYLPYFNELAGGPEGGRRFLGDSNLDWGQDLKRLRPWMEEHGVEHLKLGYFGTALPQVYGFSFEYLPSVGYLNDQPGTRAIVEGDVLAVSVTCRQGFYFDDMTLYRFLDDFERVDHLGHSIEIFRIERQQLRRGPRDVTAEPP